MGFLISSPLFLPIQKGYRKYDLTGQKTAYWVGLH